MGVLPDADGFEPVAPLGEGGTAHVYVARRRADREAPPVVLKVLKRIVANEPDIRRMFEQEGRLSQRLIHPNIAEVLDVVEHEGLPALVLEYLPGRSMAELTQRAGNGFTAAMRIRVLAEALRGLHHAHELVDEGGQFLGLVHRDMTPHNIAVTYDGRVKLLDFGIAKIGTAPGQTQTGVMKGKLRYMAPEQVAGDPLDRRADLFAVGVALWESATRSRLWGSLPEAAIMNRVLNGDIPAPRSVTPEVPDALDRICRRALASAPDDRYQTAEELRLDLLEHLGDDAPTMVAVGAMAAEAFRPEREALERALENESSGLSAFMGTGSSTTTALTAGTAPSSESRWTGAIVAIIAVGTLGLIGMAWMGSASRQEGAPREATVRITAFPGTARVSFDGDPLEGNPVEIGRASDEKSHVVTVTAPGHLPVHRKVRLDGDVDLVITLPVLPAPSSSASAAPTPRLTARPSPSVETAPPAQPPQRPNPRPRPWSAPAPRLAPPIPEASPAPSPRPAPADPCDPPHYFDARGVKKYKPECL